MSALTRRSHRSAAILCALGLLALVLGIPGTGQGASPERMTYIRFVEPVRLPAGVVLPAGQYTFEAIKADVVQVTSRDRLHVFYTGFTYREPRPRDLNPDVMVVIGERSPTGAPPVTAWYPTPIGSGHVFVYQ